MTPPPRAMTDETIIDALAAGNLLGRRMPDLDLHTADGPTRVFTLLH